MEVPSESLACPLGDGVLALHKVENLELGLCPTCGGVWYFSGQLTRLEHDGTKAAEEVEALQPPVVEVPDADKIGSCPIDKIPLHRHRYDGTDDIYVETCYECAGVFMTAASLKSLVARDHTGVQDKPGGNVAPEVLAYGAELDAEGAADLWRARMSQYAWGSLRPGLPYI